MNNQTVAWAKGFLRSCALTFPNSKITRVAVNDGELFRTTVKARFERDSEYRKEFLLEILNQIEEGNSIVAVNMIKGITEGVDK